jgi:putative hydrolase of the HAD superfamily
MFRSGLVGDYELGRIPSAEFARRSLDLLDVNLEMDEIQDIWSDIFEPVEGMEELIRVLRGRYTLVLLSNTNEWHFEHCRARYPVVHSFVHYVLSYREGCQKPDPAIYAKTAALIDSLPEETLYVDDIPANVRVARELGWRGVCFQDSAQLMREMKAEGIRCT